MVFFALNFISVATIIYLLLRLSIDEKRKTQESLRHYTAEGLRRLHRCLLAVDEEIKTSSSDGEASLELLVLEMSRPEGAAARR